MPRLIAKTKLNYATRVFEAGDEFDAETEHDARMLCDTLNAPAERKPEPMTTENTEALVGHERQGTSYDSGATGHELQGRRTEQQEQRYRHRQMKAKP